MSKIINITDKLSSDKPSITVGDKSYEVNDTMEVVFKFEETLGKGNRGMLEAMELALGKKAVKELGIDKLSVQNFKVWVIAILAAMQGITYEEAEARFQKSGL